MSDMMSNGGIENTNGLSPVGNNERIAGTDNGSEKNGFHTRTVKRGLVAIAGIAAFLVACKGADTAIQNNAEDKKNDAENNPQASQVYPADNQETQETEEYADGVPVGTFTTTPTPTVTLSPTPTPTKTVDPTETPTRIPTSMDIMERHYVLNTTAWLREGALEPELMDELLVFSSQISDYQVEGEEIVFKILLNVYGTKVEKTVRTKKLIFESVNLETDESSEREIITAESDLSEYLDLSKNYNIGLIALDEPAITQEMVEDYINGYGEYDFTLESLTRYD
jgi:hypothetical protein